MTKRNIKKFATLVKRNTQKDAIMALLNTGEEFTVTDAREAGIADPSRVVNTLKTEFGQPIYLNPRTLRGGKVVNRYRLGTAKQFA